MVARESRSAVFLTDLHVYAPARRLRDQAFEELDATLLANDIRVLRNEP
jgi:hypothetical protein